MHRQAKEQTFKWEPDVPEQLQRGIIFDRVDDDGGVLDYDLTYGVDDLGFYMWWRQEQKETQLLDLTSVFEVRLGGLPKHPSIQFELEQRYIKDSREAIEQRCILISHGQDLVNVQYISIVAQNDHDAHTWLRALNGGIIRNFRILHISPRTGLMKHWRMLVLSTNERNQITFNTIAKTFASGKTEQLTLKKCLTDLGLNDNNGEYAPSEFTFEQFLRLYWTICPREDARPTFHSLCRAGQQLADTERVVEFLNETQRDPRLNEILFPFFTPARVAQLVHKYDINPNALENDRFSFEGFLNYLMSDENSPVFLDRVDLYQDMDQPLCHYFISSSHNTYLTGRQYGGKSSVEIYRQVLATGCRSVELDCWDGTGTARGEPIITHGKAMCTDVFFKDAIVAIRDTAFLSSEYPVVLSFENHCSKANQLKMARYCIDTFGDLLLSKPFDPYVLEAGVPLPPPSLMKNKILIKNKRLRPEIEKIQLEQFLREGKLDEDPDENPETPDVVVGEIGPLEGELPLARDKVDNEAHPELSKSSNFKNRLKQFVGAKETVLSKEEEERLLATYEYTGATTNIHPLLSSLINYTHPVKFNGFECAEANNYHFHMSSFSESTGLGYLKQYSMELVNYNKRQLSRIYPKGGRVDSSNYLPQVFWNAGCQMVSLNYQTPDVALQLNQGKFEYNGSCGYLLKPDFMRRPDRQFEPFSETPVDGVIAAFCSVRVISGHFLSEKKVGTYVEVEMYGLPTDTIRKEFRTRIVPANGLNPVYNDDSQPFVFRKVVLPELAVLRFAVFDENSKLLGQRILPLDGLCAGYRHISLRTECNLPMTLPTLFCQFILKTYVPEGLGDLVDALADPRGWLNQQEKKKELIAMQMENMGIKQDEIADVPLKVAGSATAVTNNGQKTPQISDRPTEQNGPSGADKAISATPATTSTISKLKTEEDRPARSRSPSSRKDQPNATQSTKAKSADLREVRAHKNYTKMLKRHQKELTTLKATHHKEREDAQKTQQKDVNRLMGGSEKDKMKRVTVNEPRNHSTDNSKGAQTGDRQVRSLVTQQTSDWSDMMRRHTEQEHNLRLTHIKQEHETLKELVEQQHKEHFKALEIKIKAEIKEMSAEQVKRSMESTKQIETDKNIKSKTDKEGRIKEQKARNIKVYTEERMKLESKHCRQKQAQSKVHTDQLEELEKEYKKCIEQEVSSYRESQLAAKPESVV